jgi:hypothetical protein
MNSENSLRIIKSIISEQSEREREGRKNMNDNVLKSFLIKTTIPNCFE